MANWNQFTWNDGTLWGAASQPSPTRNQTKPKKDKTMTRQRYFPSTLTARPGWFHNYGTELAVANATLALPAPDVAASIADAKFLEYACGAWLTAAREFGPSCTAALEDLYAGTGSIKGLLPLRPLEVRGESYFRIQRFGS